MAFGVNSPASRGELELRVGSLEAFAQGGNPAINSLQAQVNSLFDRVGSASLLFFTNSLPAPALGLTNDFAIDTRNGNFFQKVTASSWSHRAAFWLDVDSFQPI